MKRFLSITFILMTFMSSCQKPPTIITEDSQGYSGTMKVVYEGKDFPQNNIVVKVETDLDAGTMDIRLEKVKFVPAMPVRIDVTVMEVPVTRSDDGDSQFYGDGIVPWAMGGPYDTYRVDGLQGRISDGELEFSMTFYNTKKQEGYPTSYDGTR